MTAKSTKVIRFLLNVKDTDSLDNKDYFHIGLLVCFIVLATVISSSFSRDSQTYINYFNSFGESAWSDLSTDVSRKELFFVVISKLFYRLGIDIIFLFLVFSTISLTIKFFLINKYSKDSLLSFALFSSYFFILLDSTQIRFGMAIACLYLALHYLAEGKRFLFSAMVIISAVMFHLSSLVFIVMLLFTTKKSVFWLMGAIVVAILLYSVNLHAILLGLVEKAVSELNVTGDYLNKLHRYLSHQDPDVFLGMFRVIPVLVYFCAIIVYQYRERFSAYERLCYNALLLSIFFYILLKDIVILQVRFSDMFGFSLVFLVPYVHRAISSYLTEKVAYLILVGFFFIHLLKFTLYDKMLIM